MVGPGSPDNQPLKLAGYGLLAVAAIAAIVGLITLAAGGSEAAQPDPAIQAAPSSSEIAPPPPGDPTAATPAPGAPGAPAPAAPAPAPAAPAPAAPPNQLASPSSTAALPGAGLPGSGTSGAAGSTNGGSGSKARSVTKAPVRVYNNSKITGLADRAADDIRDSGWSVTEVSNWPYSNIPTSTVYYRPGTSEQAAARNLADSFGLRSEPRFTGIQDASPGLIVIVTQDFQRR